MIVGEMEMHLAIQRVQLRKIEIRCNTCRGKRFHDIICAESRGKTKVRMVADCHGCRNRFTYDISWIDRGVKFQGSWEVEEVEG